MRIFPFAVAAALALTAGACATSPAEKSAAGETAGATAAKAGPGSKSRAGDSEKGKHKQPWWRLSQYSRGSDKPMRPGDLPPGKPGLFSGKDGEIVLFRKGEAGRSSDPTKPTKVKR